MTRQEDPGFRVTTLDDGDRSTRTAPSMLVEFINPLCKLMDEPVDEFLKRVREYLQRTKGEE